MKLAVLFNQFGPYHYARLNALGKKAELYGIEFFSKSSEYDWDPSGLDAKITFQKKTLFKDDPKNVSKADLKKKIFETLDLIQPDAVAINGWSEAGAFIALKWCLLRKIPAIAMSESTEFDARRSTIKEAVKKNIVSNFSTAIVGGAPHKEYMHKLGMPLSHIFSKYDVVDNSYFQSSVKKVKENGGEHRKSLGLPENFYLASARFIPKKNLFTLLKAFALYQSKAENSWDLVLLGDGALRGQLFNLIDELGIKEKVQMPGFKQYHEIPFYYGLANAFIHASTSEQWGLVINEAMAAGLPILISNKCGCAQDLVKEDDNGFSFDPHDAEAISEKMLRLSSAAFDLDAMSKRSLEIISDFTTDDFADNLLQAASKAISVKRKSYSLINSVALNYLMGK